MATTILVDQDNTLTDFNEVTVRYLSKMYGFRGVLHLNQCKEYNILKAMYPHLADEKISEMFEQLFSAAGFWSTMKPILGCIEVMKELCLCKKYEIFIATSPWKTSKICIPEKIQWVQENLPFFDMSRMIFCSYKHLLHADYMIDDSPVYLATSNCKKTIAFKYPYNEKIEATYKVDNWSEIRSILL
jgi:5'(3')-deoxyribonucleotidase